MKYYFRKSPIPSFLLLAFIIYFLPGFLFELRTNGLEQLYFIIFDVLAFIGVIYSVYVLDRNDLFKMKKNLITYISLVFLLLFCLISTWITDDFWYLVYNYLRMVGYYLIVLHILLFVLQDKKDKEEKLMVEEIKERTKVKKKKIKK